MFGIENLWLFVLSGFLLNVMPGPDSLLIVGREASQGFKAGSCAALGIGAGTLVHVLAAAVGLSAILATSAMAFTVVKVIGGLYLIYMAISLLLSQQSFGQSGQQGAKSKGQNATLRQIFYQGFLTNVLNPKVAIFFLAFVPQFISEASENKAMAFILLGLIFNLNGMLWCHFLAWVSSSARKKFSASERAKRWLNRVAATLFGYFGIKLVLASQS